MRHAINLKDSHPQVRAVYYLKFFEISVDYY